MRLLTIYQWAWLPTYCLNRRVRRVARTRDCKFIQHEPITITSTNLASHLRSCKKIPEAYGWKATLARIAGEKEAIPPAQNTPAAQSLGAIFASETPIPQPPTTILPPTLFRSTLIQGVVRDTFPLTFGEGEGMKQVFLLVNPLVKLPSHQTMQRDLYALFEILSHRVTWVITVCKLVSVRIMFIS